MFPHNRPTLLAVLIALSSSSILVLADIDSRSVVEKWTEFQTQFARQFRSVEEEHARFLIFEENLRSINVANADSANPETSDGAVYTHLSPFADWTLAEFKAYQRLRGDSIPAPSCELKFSTLPLDAAEAPAPSSWDWRGKGAVTPVQNQGSCGSCWAFSTMANLEGVAFVQHKNLTKLSEFELVECDKNDHGCAGGSRN